MTYNVFGGTLSLTQSINQSCCCYSGVMKQYYHCLKTKQARL